MNLPDLRVFVSAARRPSLGAAAQELHLTPSAVSKAVRRLEQHLGTPLFDRSAKQLVLNDAGHFLLQRALALLALADQARADLMGARAAFECRIGGPAILLWRHAQGLAQALRAYPQATLRLQPVFEEEALAALARGDIDAALVTGAALTERGQHWSPHWQVTPLGRVTLQLVAGLTHPLAVQVAHDGTNDMPRVVRTSSAQVLAHDFACPSRSLFCGVERGSRSDGWRDDVLPRKIRYWSDDLQLLLQLVKSGDALAYLPDFALDDPALLRIEVDDCPFSCIEQVALVWNRDQAATWLSQLARLLEEVQAEAGTAAATPD